MKVTAKKPCVSGVYEVVDEGSRYYITKDACGFLITLAKADYEPVQEWTDETGQHDGPSAMGLLACSNYRLVRHEVNELHNKYKAYAYLLEKVKQ